MVSLIAPYALMRIVALTAGELLEYALLNDGLGLSWKINSGLYILSDLKISAGIFDLRLHGVGCYALRFNENSSRESLRTP